MPAIKASQLKELPVEELHAKYTELRMELSRLKAAAERGASKKDVGKIRPLRRNIARILTVLNEKRKEESENE